MLPSANTETMEKIWYYAESGQQVGPYSENEIKALLEGGKINPQTSVWKSGMSEWQPMAQVSEFAKASPPTPKQSAASEEDAPQASLKLGGGRKYDKVNQQDDDPNAAVDIADMIRASPEGAKGKPQEPRIVQQSKVGFFESFGLGSFEAAFFAVTLILGGIACAVMMDYWHVIVMGLGLLWIIAAGFALVVRAFMKHWAWGLVYLFVPLGQLVYIVVDLQNAYKALVLTLVGIAAFITPVQTESFQNSPVYEHYDEVISRIQEEIDRQQQEMEEKRNEKLDPLEE